MRQSPDGWASEPLPSAHSKRGPRRGSKPKRDLTAGTKAWTSWYRQAPDNYLPRSFMAFDKFLKRRRQVAIQQVAAPADLVGNVLGAVARPPLERVEAEHPQCLKSAVAYFERA
jgi:hypothetical protein